MKHSLSLLLLLICGFACASDKLDLKQWNELKHVISKHRELAWAIEFDKQYPNPSDAGVRKLAQELDFSPQDMHGDRWMESSPEDLNVTVNNEPIYGLKKGRCTNIICAVRQKIRQSKTKNNQ